MDVDGIHAVFFAISSGKFGRHSPVHLIEGPNENQMKKLSLLLSFLGLVCLSFAQYQIGLVPRVSPDKSVSQTIGYTEVEIHYGSPAAKNRQIFGALVPYDKVWRAGANNATTVSFNSRVSIQNMPLDSGTYAFFLIPKENNTWTAIFSKKHKQWGAFSYDKQEDALRAEIIPGRTAYHTEELSYSIWQTGYQYGSIVLSWGYTEIVIPFETNYLDAFIEEVEERAEKQPEYIRWIVYLQGAEHLEQSKLRQLTAMAWINQAEALMDKTSEWNKQFYPRAYVKGHVYWTKAKLLAQAKDFSQAISYAEQLKGLDNTIFYERKNEGEGIDVQLDLWKKK